MPGFIVEQGGTVLAAGLRRSRRLQVRVALVSEHASPLATIGGVDSGGQNVHVAELAAGLVRLGHQVSVFTRRDAAELPERVTTAAGYEVVHLSAGPARLVPKDELWAHMRTFAEQLRRNLDLDPPDVLHAHFWMSAWAATEVARPLRLPLLITFHALGTVKQRYQGPADTSPQERIGVEGSAGRSCDHIVATCRDEVAELAQLGIRRSKISVVPCGVDLGHFTLASDAGGRDVSIPRRAVYRLVSVGRLVPRKGVGTVIEAMSRLPDAELIIAGGDGPADVASVSERARLSALAVRIRVAERVRFVGQVSRAEMPALLRSADVVVCAPWYEPFGIVPLEAMACGVPVVGSAVGGLLDSVADGSTGVLIPPRDPAALAMAVRSLLDDPARRAAFGDAGRARALRLYSWDRVAAATADIYEQVVATRRRGLEANYL
jgi:D-inositol-3-phosphate glycosyltransferase